MVIFLEEEPGFYLVIEDIQHAHDVIFVNFWDAAFGSWTPEISNGIFMENLKKE